MNSEKVWLICFANLHFIKLHFCTMNPKKSRSHKRSAFLLFSLSGLYHQDVMILKREKVRVIPIQFFDDFPKHPFNVKMDE